MPPLELPDYIEVCPKCTHPSKEYPGTYVTMGCYFCNYTGHKTMWYLEAEERDNVYSVKMYALEGPIGAGEATKEIIGHLSMSAQRWKEFSRQLGGNPLWIVSERIV